MLPNFDFVPYVTSCLGLESFDVDVKEQKVTVKGNVKPDAVFETVSKTGKKTSFWEAEAENKEAAPASASASAPTPAPTATATTTATA